MQTTAGPYSAAGALKCLDIEAIKHVIFYGVGTGAVPVTPF